MSEEKTVDRVLMVDPENCTACGICELVCSYHHHGRYSPRKAYIRVDKHRELGVHMPFLTVGCDLCEGAEKCTIWCPTKCIRFVSGGEAVTKRRSMKLSPYISPLLSTQMAERGN